MYFSKKLKSYQLLAILVIGLLILTALFLLLLDSPHQSQEPNLATVLIKEGLTVKEISELLNEVGVLENEALSSDLEGYLFPDTYEFFVSSSAEVVTRKMRENFNNKVLPAVAEALAGKPGLSSDKDLDDIITVASMIEREVPDSADRRIVSGIIWKRLENNHFLQIDSTICYLKSSPCHPITKSDLAMDSVYNTYTNLGLPPTPIANPGLDAIEAALDPEQSEYWYYISDPDTSDTIFAVNLDEHISNIVKYLD